MSSEPSASDDGPAAATTLSIERGPLVGPVLARVVGMVAARADLPVDRLDDAVLVADAIAAHAPTYVADDHVSVTITPGDRSLELRVGPLRAGGGESLLSAATVPGIGNVMERLADEIAVERSPDGRAGDYVRVKLAYGG